MKNNNRNLSLLINWLAKTKDRRKTGCLTSCALSLLGLSQDVRRKTVIFQKYSIYIFKKKNTFTSYVLRLQKTLQTAKIVHKAVRQACLTALPRIQYLCGLSRKTDVRQSKLGCLAPYICWGLNGFN